jgi:hypothetical protein
MNTNQKSFSQDSASYARSRPEYPSDLFQWLSAQCKEHRNAWDCATGNGQAAIGLAEHFVHVDATDISAEQVAEARPHPRVRYAVASAESSGLPSGQSDLIAVAQALHWFKFDEFWMEVRRVARADAFFCAWGYVWPQCPPAIEQGLVVPLLELLNPFWAANNRIIIDGYRPDDVGFPFVPIRAPSFAIQVNWTLSEFVNYLATWSAFKLSRGDAKVRNAIDQVLEHARSLVPQDEIIPIQMPLNVLAGRVLQTT